jgi:hypothetical protein
MFCSMKRSQQNFMTLVSSPQIPDAQSHRTELLDVLSEVKTKVQDRLGSVDFPLPQFILIGKQSVCIPTPLELEYLCVGR